MPDPKRKNNRVSLYCLVTTDGNHGGHSASATLANLSLGGCFITCASVPQPGEQFGLSFTALGHDVKAAAVVRWVQPGLGYGCQFMRMDLRSSQGLHGIVSRLRGEYMPMPEMVAAED